MVHLKKYNNLLICITFYKFIEIASCRKKCFISLKFKTKSTQLASIKLILKL